jgi:hypothetical protein
MGSQATYDDVNLILRLYDLRREDKMRQARDWFREFFKARTVEQYFELCPPGSEKDSFARMVTSYWEMAASFITSGVLNAELFFQSGRELLHTWEKVKELVPEMRTAMSDPTALANLEAVAGMFKEWLDRKSPDAYPAYVARVRGT